MNDDTISWAPAFALHDILPSKLCLCNLLFKNIVEFFYQLKKNTTGVTERSKQYSVDDWHYNTDVGRDYQRFTRISVRQSQISEQAYVANCTNTLRLSFSWSHL